MYRAAVDELRVLTPREASIFACLVDTVVAPEPVLPAVRETDAPFFFDRWLAASPRVNAIGIRALLYALELAPRLTGSGKRFRRMTVEGRAAFVAAVERSGNPHVRQIAKLIKGAAFLSYYGDDAIMRRVGYDPDANLARGRALRASQGRP